MMKGINKVIYNIFFLKFKMFLYIRFERCLCVHVVVRGQPKIVILSMLLNVYIINIYIQNYIKFKII